LKKEDPKEKKKVKFSVPDDKKDESFQTKSTQPVQSRKPPTKNSARPKSLPELQLPIPFLIILTISPVLLLNALKSV
jgi:hypothetical protein